MLGGVSIMFEWFSSDFCFILVGFCKVVLVRLQNFGVIYNCLPWREMHQIHAWPGHYLESSSALGNQLSIFSDMTCTKYRFQIYDMQYRDRNPSVVFHFPFHFILLLHFLSSEALLSFFSFSIHYFIFNLMPRVQPFFWVVHVGFPLLHSSHFIYLLFIHVFIVLSFFFEEYPHHTTMGQKSQSLNYPFLSGANFFW